MGQWAHVQNLREVVGLSPIHSKFFFVIKYAVFRAVTHFL